MVLQPPVTNYYNFPQMFSSALL